ncbi:exodeoxyribonuclease VII small subunit [Yanghanlia caeni]|uniref:Exodeoxyribonuclease 7 small subunit n=1 Tax=Yanghanlia caeni TaxID=3064283 RepID=A0ABU1D686_9BURK|nr:exodeoxyribonuclease VII small subunit [Alcaligenaceae bacterium LG-2]NGR08074.1 exodeoxyribonuclease VII small subunit [bacterium SGD-2]HZH57227.1 exodeoxyribonuclease VII small subunit [Burkholderiaceae bacterium]
MPTDQSVTPPAQSGTPAETLPDFESALAELEALVAKMEDGGMALDDSLRAYERGVELARICQQRLDAAEEQVRVLQGSLLKPLDTTPEADA